MACQFVKRDHVAFKMVIFFLFLHWGWENQPPCGPSSPCLLPLAPGSCAACPWGRRSRFSGIWAAMFPSFWGFPRWLLWKTSLQAAVRYHERRLLKGDGEKGDVWYVWDVYPDVSDLAVAVVKRFAYLTEIVHSCLLLPEWGIFSSCRWNWRSQSVKELCKDLWVSTPAWCSWKPWVLCRELAGLGRSCLSSPPISLLISDHKQKESFCKPTLHPALCNYWLALCALWCSWDLVA